MEATAESTAAAGDSDGTQGAGSTGASVAAVVGAMVGASVAGASVAGAGAHDASSMLRARTKLKTMDIRFITFLLFICWKKLINGDIDLVSIFAQFSPPPDLIGGRAGIGSTPIIMAKILSKAHVFCTIHLRDAPQVSRMINSVSMMMC
jgi:hypothetical protein